MKRNSKVCVENLIYMKENILKNIIIKSEIQIEIKRSINSNGKKRGNVKEVIITNYTNNKTF